MNFEFSKISKSERELGRELVKSHLFELNVDNFDNSKKVENEKSRILGKSRGKIFELSDFEKVIAILQLCLKL